MQVMINLEKTVAAAMDHDETLTEEDAYAMVIEEITAIEEHLHLTYGEAYELLMYDLKPSLP